MSNVVDAPPPKAIEAIHDASHDTSTAEPSNTVEEEEPVEANNNNDNSVKEGVTAGAQMKEHGNNEDVPSTNATTARKDMKEETVHES